MHVYSIMIDENILSIHSLQCSHATLCLCLSFSVSIFLILKSSRIMLKCNICALCPSASLLPPHDSFLVYRSVAFTLNHASVSVSLSLSYTTLGLFIRHLHKTPTIHEIKWRNKWCHSFSVETSRVCLEHSHSNLTILFSIYITIFSTGPTDISDVVGWAMANQGMVALFFVLMSSFKTYEGHHPLESA